MAAASDPSNNSPETQTRPRRPSVADIFVNQRRTSNEQKTPRSSLSAAMQQAQEQSRNRRLSITTLGLSGNAAASASAGQQPSPFGAFTTVGRARPSSEAGYSEQTDEQAIDDSDNSPPMSSDRSVGGSPPGTSGIARKLSQGAKAYGEMRAGALAGSPPGTGPNGFAPASPPSRKVEGFNWSENLRSRAERTSISAAIPSLGQGFGNGAGHRRNTSIGIPENGTVPMPAATPPKPTPKAPDHFQERILKGDFYMD